VLKPKRSNRFKKEFVLAEKRGRDMDKIIAVMDMLVNEQPLPPERKDHALHGRYEGCRECHIQNDWLLVYKLYPAQQEIVFDRTGSHADLF
jgi:mRNA interferase YafQ